MTTPEHKAGALDRELILQRMVAKLKELDNEELGLIEASANDIEREAIRIERLRRKAVK